MSTWSTGQMLACLPLQSLLLARCVFIERRRDTHGQQRRWRRWRRLTDTTNRKTDGNGGTFGTTKERLDVDEWSEREREMEIRFEHLLSLVPSLSLLTIKSFFSFWASKKYYYRSLNSSFFQQMII